MSDKTTSWKSQTSTCLWQAGRLRCRTGGKSRWHSRFGLWLGRERLQHEKGVGQHYQSQMTMQTLPAASLKVSQAAFPLGILIKLLDRPAQVCQFDQTRQGGIGGQVAEKPLRFPFLSRKRPLSKQPAFWSRPTASVRLTMPGAAGSSMHPDGDKLLLQRSLASFAPSDGLPGLFRLSRRDGARIVAAGWTRLFGLPSSTRTAWLGLGWGLFHLGGQANPEIRGHRTNIGELALIQNAQERGDAVASISHDRLKRHSPNSGLLDQLQGQLWLGGEADGFRNMTPLTARPVLCPTFRQIQVSADGPMQRAAGAGFIAHVLSTHHHLAVALFAQRSAVLMLDSHRGFPLFGQSHFVKYQDSLFWAARDQGAHTLFVQGQWVPGSIGQQMLQLFERRIGYSLGDGLAIFPRQIRQQAGHVAFQRFARGTTAKQGRKRFQKCRQFWQGIWRSLRQTECLHLAIVAQN